MKQSISNVVNRQRHGFTIIEVTTVVVILIILISISVAGVSVYLADARNDERSSKMMVLSEALEQYYDRNGEYPSCTAMRDTPSNIAALLGGIDIDTFRPPTKETPEPMTCGTSTFPSDTNDTFMYESPYDSPSNQTTPRSKYELMWWDEDKRVVAGTFSRRGN